MIEVYHNPRCRKSREAVKLLEEKGVDFTIREYLKNPPTQEELKKVLAKLNLKPTDIIRKNEAEYKENFKGKDFTDEEWIKILTEHPKLIERPVVITDKKAVIGRPPEKVLEIV